MPIDPKLASEGADWIAEMISAELESFVPSELCDIVMEAEQKVRDETGDQRMSHDEMAKRLMAIFEADPEIPTQEGAVSEFLVREILHWEDEFLTMAGAPRQVNR
ncbi:MAG: hypothetical protein C4558_00500 [Dehalococcoidia bacterium]|nr:MAG: hypothetical protein C4558_00500 [Dehalococcoidia bacterium]